MKSEIKNGLRLTALAGVAFGVLWSGMASAAANGAVDTVDVYLVAKRFVLPVNGEDVAMWGYAELASAPTGAGDTNCGNNSGSLVASATAATPGLSIEADEGDTLNIHLLNCVPNLDNEVARRRVSVMIPGQRMPSVTDPNPGNNGADGPQFFNANQAAAAGDPDFEDRMRSQVKETRRRTNGRWQPVTYEFGPLRAGSYIYHSGTHMQVQVQMGLHGPLTVRPIGLTNGAPYADGVQTVANGNPKAYHAETSIFYSEIDPDIHAAVDTSDYGPGKSVTSTINYSPKYLLINGQPFDGAKKDLQAELAFPNPNQGRRVLVRVRSASIRYHMIACKFCAGARAIAEDGYVYTFAADGTDISAGSGTAYEQLGETFLVSPMQTRDLAINNVDPDNGGPLTRQLSLDLDRFGVIPPVVAVAPPAP